MRTPHFQNVQGHSEGQISKVFQRYSKVLASFRRNGRFGALLGTGIPFFSKMSGVAGSVQFQRYFKSISRVRAVLGERGVWDTGGSPFPPAASHKPRCLEELCKEAQDTTLSRTSPLHPVTTARHLGASRLHPADFDPVAYNQGFTQRLSDGRMKDFATNALETGRARAKRCPSRLPGDMLQGEARRP